MKAKDQIIFFDGHCNLCNGFIDFIVRWDKNRIFKVASLQGQTATEKLDPTLTTELSSVVLLNSQSVFTKTDAVLRITSSLHWLFRPVIILFIIPSFIRDPFYNFIAKNRYKFFGKKESCRLPTPEEQDTFLP